MEQLSPMAYGEATGKPDLSWRGEVAVLAVSEDF
jgi:hypothetical protein